MLTKYFNGYMTGMEAEMLIAEQLEKRGFTSYNTLFADCICPDEINHDDPDEDISAHFTKRWGEVFNLGGLAGLPFVGQTGWNAFSSHVPKDGNIVVLYAPHVGVDSEGVIGKVKRNGQEESSATCGAACGAYASVKQNSANGNFLSGYKDYQMDSIKSMIIPHIS